MHFSGEAIRVKLIHVMRSWNTQEGHHLAVLLAWISRIIVVPTTSYANVSRPMNPKSFGCDRRVAPWAYENVRFSYRGAMTFYRGTHVG